MARSKFSSSPRSCFGFASQEILAELGVAALQRGTRFKELLDRAVQLAAEGLEAELSKFSEYIPEENRLLMRAGVGWDPGLIGIASVGADRHRASGFALRTGKPVISNHLEHEGRFRTPDLLRAHGVRRAINVILQGDGSPFGVLEVDSRSEGEFSEHDIAFLQGTANILGMAIDRPGAMRAAYGMPSSIRKCSSRDQSPRQEQPAIGCQHVYPPGGSQ